MIHFAYSTSWSLELKHGTVQPRKSIQTIERGLGCALIMWRVKCLESEVSETVACYSLKCTYSLHTSKLCADTYNCTPLATQLTLCPAGLDTYNCALCLPPNSLCVLQVLPSDCRMYPELHSHLKEPARFTHL